MISDLKTAIVSKLFEIYQIGYVTYDEDLPESFSKPAFLIQITNQSYHRRLSNKFSSEVSFDITYYSDQSAIRADCIRVQETLLKAFDMIGTYQVMNKISKITDGILHFTFDIRYCEMLQEEECLMQQQQTNTNI
jgi:hypothetical protein